jgi:hypothetical protein
MQLFIYKTNIADKEVNLISFLPTCDVFKTGLTENGIVGSLRNDSTQLTNENILINPAFINLFQNVVKETAITDKSLHDAAEKQYTGFIYIIDQRDKNYPDTIFVDIVGWFTVTKGKISLDSYQPNEDYQIVSSDGVFQLATDYEQNLLIAMRQ